MEIGLDIGEEKICVPIPAPKPYARSSYRSRRNWAKARSEMPSLARKPTGSTAPPRLPGRCDLCLCCRGLGGRSRGAEEEDELQR